jgi:hypothetical protein
MPRMEARRPKVDARRLKMETRRPKMEASIPKMDARRTKIEAKRPKMEARICQNEGPDGDPEMECNTLGFPPCFGPSEGPTWVQKGAQKRKKNDIEK